MSEQPTIQVNSEGAAPVDHEKRGLVKGLGALVLAAGGGVSLACVPLDMADGRESRRSRALRYMERMFVPRKNDAAVEPLAQVRRVACAATKHEVLDDNEGRAHEPFMVAFDKGVLQQADDYVDFSWWVDKGVDLPGWLVRLVTAAETGGGIGLDDVLGAEGDAKRIGDAVENAPFGFSLVIEGVNERQLRDGSRHNPRRGDKRSVDGLTGELHSCTFYGVQKNGTPGEVQGAALGLIPELLQSRHHRDVGSLASVMLLDQDLVRNNRVFLALWRKNKSGSKIIKMWPMKLYEKSLGRGVRIPVLRRVMKKK